MHKLVLIRHGESTWNLENRFTGWTDAALTPLGVRQAQQAGRLLKAEGLEFDVAHTSVLKRAIWTLWHTLDQMDRTWLPVVNDWRLNERRYGVLQGLNQADMVKKFGAEQVLVWRRSYATRCRCWTRATRAASAATRATRSFKPPTRRSPSACRTRWRGFCRSGTTPSHRPSAPARGSWWPRTATASAPW